MEFLRVVRPLKLFREGRSCGYGWYNEEMALRYGYIEASNTKGERVKVTVVTDYDVAPFPNCIKLGFVSKFCEIIHDPDLWKYEKDDAPEGFRNAWYSPYIAVKDGYCIYQDELGNPVMITIVSRSGKGYHGEVVDLRYMGLVKDYCISGNSLIKK